jgi:para-nitrobenzyl esterase
MRQLFGLPVGAVGLLLALPVAAALPTAVVTGSGPVSGVSSADGAILAFKGIPYAAPPVGERRWRAPSPPTSWTAVRKADKYSASCMQHIVEERKPWTHEFMAHNAISEDCLYLNVWTPAKGAADKLPVYFWIYGGGYVEGSTAVPAYDGENLARRGVVVVTINYRLGVFGFLTHPELTREAGRSGNYGSLDQLAALQWVQKNIAGFGGDPGNVTISGQSAGSNGVHNLVASPLAHGLFQRAVAESGSGYVATAVLKTMHDAEADGVKFASSRGAKGLKELRALPAQALMPGADETSASSAFRPVVDDYFLAADPNEIFATGKQNDVPELTGMNRDERSSEADYGTIPMASYASRMRQRYGAAADRFFKLYPNDSQEHSGTSQQAALRDSGLVSMYMWGQLRAKTARSPAFTYYWTHAEPGPDSARYGAFHTSEVPYVFNSLNQSQRPWTDADHRMADLLGSYWVNFMKSGDPNGPGLPAWPKFDAASPATMELGDKPGTRPVADKAKLDFWEAYLRGPSAIAR